MTGPAAAPPEALGGMLEAWLPGQRWFAGKGRTFSVIGMKALGVLTGWPHRSDVWLVRVGYDDGSTETYQVPLVRWPHPAEQLAHVLIGETPDPDYGGRSWWYDALHDKDVTGAWLAGIAAGRTEGALVFVPGPRLAGLPLDAKSLVIPNEQSNTSLVFDDAAILKVFRRVYPGRNPDIEVHQALSQLEGGARHVARLLGHVSGGFSWGGTGGEEWADLAMLQEFFRTATDGWELAKISVRDLYAEADLHADEVGGDFAGEAQRLGVATAEVHADLARALPTAVLGTDQLGRIADGMHRRLEAALAAVPQLAEYGPGLRSAFDALAAHEGGVPVQRVHGDYHLGQVLRTSHRWVVLDFEGEPAKPLSERTGLDSPMKDVAGMLRSFDYAARHLLADHPHQPQLSYRADEWAARNRQAFCDGYAEAGGQDPRSDSALLRAYEADKAVYEAVYEARNRPSWLPIPLASLARLTEGARS